MSVRQLAVFILLSLCTSWSYGREVELSWEPFPETLGYHILISKTANFKKPIIKKALKTPGLTINLDIGTYFYKVRAVDKDKQPGHWSEPMKFEVTPYPPELKSPKSETDYSFYEVSPKIEFEWKSVGDEPEYEIFIYKTTGKKAFEGKTKDTKITVSTLREGEYMWKMRTVYKGIYESPYGEPRRFTVEKKDLEKPELVSPEDKADLVAYQGFDLEWKKDPASHFTDVSLKYVDADSGQSAEVPVPPNLEDTETHSVDFAEPGEYTWQVRTKEAQKTEGVLSDSRTFKVRKDLVSDNNSSFYFGLGYSSLTNAYTSTKTGSNTKGEIKSAGFNNVVNASYYFSQGYGLQLDFYHATLREEEWDLPEFSYTLTNRFRMGTPGFNQQFFIGYRQLNAFEILASPAKTYNLFTTNGFVVGQQMNGSLGGKMRLSLEALYYKPTGYNEDNGKMTADFYEGAISLAYNPSYKFWVAYEFRYMKGVFNAAAKDQPDGINTQWDVTTIQPFLIKIGFEN